MDNYDNQYFDMCNVKDISKDTTKEDEVFDYGDVPFDTYKVVKNGNCIITCNRDDLNISNKHNAIVFYKKIYQ